MSRAVVQWRRPPGTLTATIVRPPKAVNCLVDIIRSMWHTPRTRRWRKCTVALTAVVCHNRVVVTLPGIEAVTDTSKGGIHGPHTLAWRTHDVSFYSTFQA